MFRRLLRRRLILFVGVLVLLAVAIEVYAGARTDLDWMVVCGKFQLGQGKADVNTWEFSPHSTMNWWDAYMFTVARIVVSCVIFGVVAAVLVFIFYYKYSRPCVARSNVFLAVKGCVKGVFGMVMGYGKSSCFSALGFRIAFDAVQEHYIFRCVDVGVFHE